MNQLSTFKNETFFPSYMTSLVKKKKQSENARLEFPGTAWQLMLTEFLTDTTPHYLPPRAFHSFICPTCVWRHHCINPDHTDLRGPHLTNDSLCMHSQWLSLPRPQQWLNIIVNSLIQYCKLKSKLTCHYTWDLPVVCLNERHVCWLFSIWPQIHSLLFLSCILASYFLCICQTPFSSDFWQVQSMKITSKRLGAMKGEKMEYLLPLTLVMFL